MRFDINTIMGSRSWQQARRHGPLLLGGVLLAMAAWQAAQLTWIAVETAVLPPSLPPAETLAGTGEAIASPESMQA
ncbi:MAG TPA: hypothetical protein VF267_14065, partial [Gammaproteobacteria bacterium]